VQNDYSHICHQVVFFPYVPSNIRKDKVSLPFLPSLARNPRGRPCNSITVVSAVIGCMLGASYRQRCVCVGGGGQGWGAWGWGEGSRRIGAAVVTISELVGCGGGDD
jgi:hypothetical protein